MYLPPPLLYPLMNLPLTPIQVFLDTLDIARGRSAMSHPETAQQQQQQRRAFGAAIPALGLSNKAVYEEANDGGNAGRSPMPHTLP